MDAVMEKTCYDDISHTVLDAKQKISVRSISNNYGLPFADAVKVLQQWIDKNSAKAKLIIEFIVRGISSQHGNAFIAVANEQKLKTIQSKAKQCSSVLYSVEVASESSRSLTIPEDQEFRVINLPLQADKRDIKVFTPTDPPPVAVKQEPKSKITSMFTAGTSKSTTKTETIKEEKQSPKVTVKQESPKGSSQKKSPVKTSPNKKKETNKPISGKGSIASFFNNKPSTKAATTSAPLSVKQEKCTPKKEESNEDSKSNGKQEDKSQRWKRMISDDSDDDDVIPSTPQDKKETKKGGSKKLPTTRKAGNLKKENPNKKSRIMQIDDSSEEEEEGEKGPKEPEDREIQFDVEETNDVEMKETKTQEDSPKQPVQNGTDRKKAMVKKLVTKTFQDEEGYLITVKEYEMVEEDETVAAAGDDNNVSEKKSAQNGKVASVDPKAKSSKVTDKKPSKVTPPTPKTKQGSITSFFSRR